MKISRIITSIIAILILLCFAGYIYYDQIQAAPTYTITKNNEPIKLMGVEGNS